MQKARRCGWEKFKSLGSYLWCRRTEAFSTSGCRNQWQDPRGYTHFKRPTRYAFDRQRTLGLLAGVGGLGSIAYYNSLQEVPYTHREHAIWVSQQMEQALGIATFNQFKAQAEQAGTLLPQSHPAVRRIERIGREIVNSALEGKGGGYMQHMQGLEWEFIVIRRGDPNAMVVPGGKVIVHSGLLDTMGSDDEIAAVLGHEVAHVVARHVAEKLSKAQIFELLRVLVFWTIGIPIPGGAVQLAVFLPNSRKLETEADLIGEFVGHLSSVNAAFTADSSWETGDKSSFTGCKQTSQGMQIAAQSCFDPAAAVGVFRKLGEIERQSSAASIPGFLRTHPLTDARVKTVQAEIGQARQVYETSGCSFKRGSLAGMFRTL